MKTSNAIVHNFVPFQAEPHILKFFLSGNLRGKMSGTTPLKDMHIQLFLYSIYLSTSLLQKNPQKKNENYQI
jgi:hypothetical protein